MTKTLMLLPGDGIGPEVMAETRKIIDWANDARRGYQDQGRPCRRRVL
jgi:3-isopropylmalate dehydrogenase